MPRRSDPNSQRSQFADIAWQIADHQARIQVIAANWAETITEHLNATERKLLSAIARELKNFTFRPNSKETLVKLKRIHTVLRKLRLAGWKAAQEAIEREALELAGNEAKWAQKVAKVTSDPKDAAKLHGVSDAKLDKVVKFGLADGKTVNEYFDHLADDEGVRLDSMIRQGVESGWTIDQMTRNIAGTAANDYTDGLLNVSRNAAKMMARTLTNAVANNAKDAFYQENAEIIPQVEILSTLDGRTCVSCASLDRKRFKTGEPHPSLPIHHNCRCVLLPVTLLSDLVEEQRPMARSDFMADAKRAYEAKYPGKKWKDLSESTRKKYYYKAMREYERTTGQSAYTQVSGGMSYKEYLQNGMNDQQRRDWLGKKRYRIWQHGNLSLDNYIPPYPNKALTIEKLKELDKASFAKKSPTDIIKRTTKLSKEEVDAIEQYTKSDDYAEMNAYLRTGQTGNDYFDRETQLLNSAIAKSEVSEDITVWRGVSRADLRTTNEKFSEVPIDAFTSTSLSRSVADKFSGDNHKAAVIYKITVPKGSHAIDAMGVSMKPEEREILLPPGGKFTVQRVYYEKENDGSNGRQIVEVTYGT